MKKTFIGVAATALIMMPLVFVSADATTSTSTKGQWGARWQEKREELQQKREEIKNRFEEKRNEMQEARQQKISDILKRVSERFQNAIDRLTSFADRIDARLVLLKDKGVDVTASQKSVDLAHTTLNDAQKALNDIDIAGILEDFGTTTPSGAIAELRTQLSAVKDLIKKAHGELVDAIVALKAGITNADKDNDDNSDDDDDDN